MQFSKLTQQIVLHVNLVVPPLPSTCTGAVVAMAFIAEWKIIQLADRMQISTRDHITRVRMQLVLSSLTAHAKSDQVFLYQLACTCGLFQITT